MSKPLRLECPKCYTIRTLLDTSFALPGFKGTRLNESGEDCINVKCVVPVRLLMCPGCHLLELYHDVGDLKQTT
jgi:hypothetical protein